MFFFSILFYIFCFKKYSQDTYQSIIENVCAIICVSKKLLLFHEFLHYVFVFLCFQDGVSGAAVSLGRNMKTVSCKYSATSVFTPAAFPFHRLVRPSSFGLFFKVWYLSADLIQSAWYILRTTIRLLDNGICAWWVYEAFLFGLAFLLEHFTHRFLTKALFLLALCARPTFRSLWWGAGRCTRVLWFRLRAACRLGLRSSTDFWFIFLLFLTDSLAADFLATATISTHKPELILQVKH